MLDKNETTTTINVNGGVPEDQMLDAFAASALTGLLSCHLSMVGYPDHVTDKKVAVVCDIAYKVAAGMMEARAKLKLGS